MANSTAPPFAPLAVLSPGPRLAGMPSKGMRRFVDPAARLSSADLPTLYILYILGRLCQLTWAKIVSFSAATTDQKAS